MLKHVGLNVKIGENVKIWHFTYAGDGTEIGDGTKIGSLVHVRARVERGAVVCAGAVLKAGIRVGARSIVGMGAVVTKDVPPEAVVFGNPARIRYSSTEYLEKKKRWEKEEQLLFMEVIDYFFDALQYVLYICVRARLQS